MLNLIGDILNWLAAGAMFPLMILPLALLLSGGRRAGAWWVGLIIGFVAGGAAFARLTPGLALTPGAGQAATFAGVSAAVIAGVAIIGGPARFAALAAPLFESLTRGSGRAVMWFLLVMALVQFAVVVLRYVFGINYIFMQESITYMHGAVFLLAGGYALLTDDHVRVDIFYREAAPKRKALVDFLGTYFLLFPVCLLLLWAAAPYVANSWAVGEGSQEASGIQAVFIMKSFIPAFAVLLAMAGFNIAARAGETLRERA